MFILLMQNEMEARVHSDSTDCTEEEAFTEVLGVSRSGHVRGMGLGVKPIRPKSSRATSASQIDVHEECRKQREELETSYQSLREQMAASQERMRAELAASQEQMATLQERMRAEMQAEMQKLLSQFQGLENFFNRIFFIHTHLICNY
jgi:septal ring factor EnvC (AmiA/AmiB activator)